MCFGPSKAEKEAAAEQREQADQQLAAERKKTAEQKQKDIIAALSRKTAGQAKGRGGYGRRSLFSGGASGFLGRFN